MESRLRKRGGSQLCSGYMTGHKISAYFETRTTHTLFSDVTLNYLYFKSLNEVFYDLR